MTWEEWDCVAERSRELRKIDGQPSTEELEPIWHVARHRGRTLDWVPLRCSEDEGIALPGPIVRREPTCKHCNSIVNKGREA